VPYYASKELDERRAFAERLIHDREEAIAALAVIIHRAEELRDQIAVAKARLDEAEQLALRLSLKPNDDPSFYAARYLLTSAQKFVDAAGAKRKALLPPEGRWREPGSAIDEELRHLGL
jgi:hypothetical protein